ncbi:uncharacterized protein LOC128882804 [Hylaeus volcanicus]|uniref:uncharacterized protein LOC128882804 n=1 Tax=Hylaeus volcanicus TaxID=313075 RepID=UPI0023B798AD|nr:uncharacterized protein LOC128882804 [Hylaeus volcanicus]
MCPSTAKAGEEGARDDPEFGRIYTGQSTGGRCAGAGAGCDGGRIRPGGGHGHGLKFMPPVRIFQAKLNHSARAQDLFVHCLAELGVGLAVAAEPYRVVDHPNCVADALGSVVILGGDTAALRVFTRGDGFVGAECGGLALIGVYAAPSAPLAAFEWLLDGVRDALSRSPVARTLVLGDFNAKSTSWGGPATDAWGRASADLRLLNRGSVSTCVRWQGESIVDLSWATPAAARLVSGWRVAEEVESLSDHLYILMDVSAAPQYHPARRPAPGRPPRRWALKRLEKDTLMPATHAASWPDAPAGPVADVDREADWFRESLMAAFDAAIPRARRLPRRAAYWWSDEIGWRLVSTSPTHSTPCLGARSGRRSENTECLHIYGSC